MNLRTRIFDGSSQQEPKPADAQADSGCCVQLVEDDEPEPGEA